MKRYLFQNYYEFSALDGSANHNHNIYTNSYNLPYWRPVRCSKLPIDPPHQLVHFFLQILIFLHIRPRRHSHLQKRNILDVLRMLFQQSFERQKPVHQTFGVIQPVDAQNDLLRRRQDLRGLLRQFHEPLERNADRKGSYAHSATAVFN